MVLHVANIHSGDWVARVDTSIFLVSDGLPRLIKKTSEFLSRNESYTTSASVCRPVTDPLP